MDGEAEAEVDGEENKDGDEEAGVEEAGGVGRQTVTFSEQEIEESKRLIRDEIGSSSGSDREDEGDDDGDVDGPDSNAKP